MHTAVKDIKNFINFAAKEIGLTSIPTINLVGSSENKNNSFGHFLGTRKGKSSITVRITDRHPIDVMRTIAHELIHYHQLSKRVGSSEQMKEDEANALAGRIMRKFDTTHPKVFGDKPIIENEAAIGMVAANHMGSSSSTPGTGAIDTIDPVMGKKKKSSIFRRTAPVAENLLTKNTDDSSILNKVMHSKPKKLRDILAHEKHNEKRADTRIS